MAWLGLVGCTHHGDETQGAGLESPVPRAESPTRPTDPTLATVPSSRRCGEVGTIATPAPSGLMHAVEEVGRKVLEPDQKVRIGNVDLEYGSAVRFGTRRAFDDAPGLVALIDKSVEPIDGAWGGQQQLYDNGEAIAFEVGPYRIEGHPVVEPGTGAGALPRLEVRLLRRGCPAYAAVDWPRSDEISLWLGNAAMRAQTVTATDGWLQVSTSERGAGEALHLRWSWSGVDGSYDDAFDVTPDAVGRRIEGLGIDARIAAIEPSAGVSFVDGRWEAADGTPVVAVRVDIRRSTKVAARRSSADPGPGCGEPGIHGGGLVPQDAAAAPRVAEVATVDVGKPSALGPLTMTLEHQPGEERSGARVPLPEAWVLSARDSGGQVLKNAFLRAGMLHPMRVDDAVLILEPVAPPTPVPLRVRRLAVTCPEAWQGPLAAGAQQVWLGTLGITQASFMGPSDGIYALHAQLGADGADVNLSVSGEPTRYSSSKVSPAIVGQTFRIRDRRVEILAVEAGEGTRWARGQWRFQGDAGPNVLVHVGLTPLR